MAIKVGINGFGRIGRNVFRAGFRNKDIEFVAVNDLPVPPATLAHILKHDSNFGILDAEVKTTDDGLRVDGKLLKVLSVKNPSELPWGQLGVDIVIESTGIYTDATKAKAHIDAGAKKVIISAPATNEDITIVLGVNEDRYDAAKHHVLSNASCTTNCLGPMAKVLDENFGIVHGQMTTVHSYTNDQRILDLQHKDLRRTRSAAVSIIPTTTGAAKAIGLVLPQLKGKLDGMAMRVPTPNVSVVDLVVEVKKETNVEEVNAAFKNAANGSLKAYMEFCEIPLVSKDFNGNPKSCIVDAALTKVLDGKSVKVIGWYDNEWGYSNRVVDLCLFLGKKLSKSNPSTAAATV